jgi:hypothetical protein
MGLHYEHYFAEVINSRALTGHTSPSPYSGCLIDFNGLFIGGTIQTFLGILLGMTHAYLASPSTHSNKNFHPVTFWKHSAGKHNDEAYLNAKHYVEHHTSHRDIWSRYGIWPWYLWFGYKTSLLKSNRRIITKRTEQTTVPFDKDYLVYRRWKFRRTFWKRWIQVTMLGTPTLLFYTLETGSRHPILRSGTVLYGLMTCSLLLWYRLWNEKDYIHILNKQYNSKDIDNVGAHAPNSDLLNLAKNMDLYYNTHNTLYSLWMLTCVTLILFQTMPFLTSFYRVIISTAIVIFVSLSLGKLSTIKCKSCR